MNPRNPTKAQYRARRRNLDREKLCLRCMKNPRATKCLVQSGALVEEKVLTRCIECLHYIRKYNKTVRSRRAVQQGGRKVGLGGR